VYKLGKRVISQFIRTGCRCRLRLDLYAGVVARRRSDVPAKDSGRPCLTLLQNQGRQYERQKYAELEMVFPGRITTENLPPAEPTALEELDRVSTLPDLRATGPAPR